MYVVLHKHFYNCHDICQGVISLWRMRYTRALTDITSGPEVRQIFKIRTVRKPDVFLLGRRTFNTFKNIFKNPKFKKTQKNFFAIFFFKKIFPIFFFHNFELLTLNLCPGRLNLCLMRFDNPDIQVLKNNNLRSYWLG